VDGHDQRNGKEVHMKSTRNTWVVLLVLFLSPAVSGLTQQVGQQGFVLITSREAEQLRQTKKEWQVIPRLRGVSPGPRILIENPKIRITEVGPTIETISPADLFVMFEANRAPVDMDSLQVKAKKGFFSKSLTDRLRPYIQGTTLKVKRAKMPKGRFTLQVSIADQEGAKTTEIYRLIVRER